MHPESDALLDAIFDAPDDDTPRLVYADWLQEHGQSAYADFVRLQCAAAREPLWSDAANRLWEEIGRVWTRLDEEWWPATRDVWGVQGVVDRWDHTRGQFGGWVSEPGWRYERLDAVHFERGFLRASCVMDYRQLVRYSNSCWPWLPLPATALECHDYEAEHDLLAHPRLARIRRLRPVAGEGGHDHWALIQSPRLSNLEALDLSGISISSDDAEWLLTPEAFPSLREVRLRVCDSDSQRAGLAGCIGPDVDPSTRHLQQLRDRFEARFEKVVWLTVP